MAIMDKQSVELHLDGAIGTITVNRPESLNALNIDVLQGMLLIIDEIRKHKDLRCIILTGAGEKAFVAGADIATMNQLGPRAIADYVELGQRVMRTIELLDLPVIAAVNGFALGGGLELALACDLICAADTAKVGQPEVNLGIIPGFGGTQRLLHRAGIGVTRRLVYTGEIITAQEALAVGIVDKLFPASELIASVRAIADTIASKGPCAVSGAKEVIRQSQDTVLLSGLRLEAEKFLSLFATFDREEGMTAFLQKRKPTFSGK